MIRTKDQVYPSIEPITLTGWYLTTNNTYQKFTVRDGSFAVGIGYYEADNWSEVNVIELCEQLSPVTPDNEYDFLSAVNEVSRKGITDAEDAKKVLSRHGAIIV